MSLTNQFESDADALTVQDNQLSGIAALARQAKLLEKEIEDITSVLNERQDQYRKLTEQAIPEAMAETGMKKFVMDDGSMIEVKPFYSASIPKARQSEAFTWLRNQGVDDIIKNTISVRFGRGEDSLSENLRLSLKAQGYPVEQTEKVDPQTLKAWVKERIEKGQVIDSELFGVFIGQKAVIKSA